VPKTQSTLKLHSLQCQKKSRGTYKIRLVSTKQTIRKELNLDKAISFQLPPTHWINLLRIRIKRRKGTVVDDRSRISK
jgi:hypothetical protein